MKSNLLISFLIVLLIAPCAKANDPEINVVCVHSCGTEQPAKSFYIEGADAEAILTAIRDGETEKPNRLHVFRKRRVRIAGIDRRVTLRVQDGMHYRYSDGSGGFRTFLHKTDRDARLEADNEWSVPGIIIYVRKWGRHVPIDQEAEQAVIEYLKELVD